MRKIVAFGIALIIAMSNIGVMAYEYPHEFWVVDSAYGSALAAEDWQSIIRYGERELEIISGEPVCAETVNIRATRNREVGRAYTMLGQFEKAYGYHKEFSDIAKNNRGYLAQIYNSTQLEELYESVEYADLAVLQYTPELSMYTDRGASPYYGETNEKKNGVLFGACDNGEIREDIGNESMVLTYQEFGQDMLPYNVGVLRRAKENGWAVEYALNCPNQWDDIRNFDWYKSQLADISALFSEYSGVPIYLRFAAEFNIWDGTPASPDEFKRVFRYLSDYFKSRNSNVAIVWSPNQTSSYRFDVHSFYPGDDYVDWVGISSYAVKYYRGDKNQSEWASLLFAAGPNSSPVLAIKDIVDTYGDRKPIMLSESGAAHQVYSAQDNSTEFAKYRLQEYYAYLPMVYPQIKLIALFDHYVDGEVFDFRVSFNKQLTEVYLKHTKGARFIQHKYNGETGFCYRKITDNLPVESVFPVSSYAYIHNDMIENVAYFIDGEYVGMATEMPFTTVIDAGDRRGAHTLKAIAKGKSGRTVTDERNIIINKTSEDITVEISGERVSFDQEPVLYNDRTMVPMRKIFEELGATVSWDETTETATGKKGDRIVKVTVGSNEMYVNSKRIELDTAPIVMSARTLVPVRAVAEGLGCTVEWDERTSTVLIEPKVFKWSEWDEDLPSGINNDMYYIEEKELYRYRNKRYVDKELLMWGEEPVDIKIDYGNWSSWTTDSIRETDDLQVETRTQNEPVMYHYTHFCTGNNADENYRYKTSSRKFHDSCLYHELGWFDYVLPYADEDRDNYIYYVDGEKYRCSNSCFRWYITDTTGGTYTEYRSRPIYRTYVVERWESWSDWDDDYPYDADDIDEMTVYRYKEK
ncbi:MAG: stalk domain-containing protein [Clostridia bacterium]|nr:stalk domain-containing protein [Clostridia bacterium]